MTLPYNGPSSRCKCTVSVCSDAHVADVIIDEDGLLEIHLDGQRTTERYQGTSRLLPSSRGRFEDAICSRILPKERFGVSETFCILPPSCTPKYALGSRYQQGEIHVHKCRSTFQSAPIPVPRVVSRWGFRARRKCMLIADVPHPDRRLGMLTVKHTKPRGLVQVLTRPLDEKTRRIRIGGSD